MIYLSIFSLIFFWTCIRKHLKTCVALIIIRSQYPMVLQKLYLLFLAVNYVTLFCVKINSIVKALCPGIKCSLYVDDFLICYRSEHIYITERHLQRCFNKQQDWADSNGFKFSTSKTCIHFCRLRKSHPDPQLFLNGNPVHVVEEVKFLGIIFDRKFSFLPHLCYLKNKCKSS